MFNLGKAVTKINKEVSCTAIIVAAGSSTRMKEVENKQVAEVWGKPILAYTLDSFQDCDFVDEIVVVAREEDVVDYMNTVVEPYEFTKVKSIIVGGDDRQQSVYNGLKEVDPSTDIVIIHDGARPLVSVEDIENSINECIECKAVVIGVPVKDTIKVVDGKGFIVETPDRENLWIAQTPQTFHYNVILKAHENALDDGTKASDDAILVERLGYKVKMVEGSYQNIKITTDEDLNIVEAFLENDWVE